MRARSRQLVLAWSWCVIAACASPGRTPKLADSGASDAAGSTPRSAGSGGTRATARNKDFGEQCNRNTECGTGYCALVVHYCTRSCVSSAECPAFWNCESASGAEQKLCLR